LITGVIIALLVAIVFDNWQFWLALAGAIATWYVISSEAVQRWLKRRDGKIEARLNVHHRLTGYGHRFDTMGRNMEACKEQQRERYIELKSGQENIENTLEEFGDKLLNQVQAFTLQMQIDNKEERAEIREEIKYLRNRVDGLYTKLD
jgi:gas vesicle protein